jgi:predicted translin family RNA/ssDNA-binding protein
MYTPHHVWNLGKSLNRIWGEDTTEDMLQLSNKILKLSNHDRKLIYDVYRTCLTDIEQGNYTQEEKYQKLREALHDYNKIVGPLLK